MNGIDDLDLLLRDHYARAADTSASEAQIADVLRTVTTTSQRRGILAPRRRARTARSSVRARGPYRNLGLAALLALTAAAALVAGSGLLRSPEPSPREYAGIFQSLDSLPGGAYATGLLPLPDGDALVIHRDLDELGDDVLRFDAEAGTWTGAGSLLVGRMEPASVLLKDGRVLVIGSGLENLTHEPAPAEGFRAELFDPATGTSVLSGPTLYQHSYGHSATLLDDGRVLIAGGDGRSTGPAELYDPRTDTFSATAPMSRYRTGHAAVRLLDGRVLIVGGDVEGPASAELFDPAAGTFTPAGPMPVAARAGFSASLLADGRVLIVGGYLADDSMTGQAQVFDPATDTFSTTHSLPAPRAMHSAATLADGRVLILGGFGEGLARVEDAATAFVYDPGTALFTPATSMTTRRLAPLTATLADGRVLVVGSGCWNPGCYGLGDDYAGTYATEVYQ